MHRDESYYRREFPVVDGYGLCPSCGQSSAKVYDDGMFCYGCDEYREWDEVGDAVEAYPEDGPRTLAAASAAAYADWAEAKVFGGRIYGPCPFHDGGNPGSFTLFVDSGWGMCHSSRCIEPTWTPESVLQMVQTTTASHEASAGAPRSGSGPRITPEGIKPLWPSRSHGFIDAASEEKEFTLYPNAFARTPCAHLSLYGVRSLLAGRDEFVNASWKAFVKHLIVSAGMGKEDAHRYLGSVKPFLLPSLQSGLSERRGDESIRPSRYMFLDFDGAHPDELSGEVLRFTSPSGTGERVLVKAPRSTDRAAWALSTYGNLPGFDRKTVNPERLTFVSLYGLRRR